MDAIIVDRRRAGKHSRPAAAADDTVPRREHRNRSPRKGVVALHKEIAMDPTVTRLSGILALMFSVMLVSLVARHVPDMATSGLATHSVPVNTR
jgi:hypothetical protein